MNTDKISYIVCLHGNEKLPMQAFLDMKKPHIVGNPEAVAKNKRYIDRDLNSSFNIEDDGSYEMRRAKELLDEIPEQNFVVDFHTTTTETYPFVIIVNKDMLNFASTTGIERIVIMDNSLKGGHALINHRHGISMEMGRHDDKLASYELTKKVVENIEKEKTHQMSIYEVYEAITEPGNYVNFEEHPDGFIPILAGEKSYELLSPPIYGLKAKTISSPNF